MKDDIKTKELILLIASLTINLSEELGGGGMFEVQQVGIH